MRQHVGDIEEYPIKSYFTELAFDGGFQAELSRVNDGLFELSFSGGQEKYLYRLTREDLNNLQKMIRNADRLAY